MTRNEAKVVGLVCAACAVAFVIVAYLVSGSLGYSGIPAVIVFSVLSFLLAGASVFFAIRACVLAKQTADDFLDLQSRMEARTDAAIRDIRRIDRELEINEQTHGALAMEIDEISKLKKLDGMRDEVLKTSSGKRRKNGQDRPV